MKHTTILLFLLAATTMTAQVKLPDFPNTPRVLGTENLIPDVAPQSIAAPVSARQSVRRASEDQKAGYLPPVGTLFLGLDEKGEGVWFTGINGVIGAWSDSIPCWQWTNNVKGNYQSITYTNRNLTANASYLEDKCYFTDDKGNFYDSIASKGGWDESYMMNLYGDENYSWLRAIPMQTVKWNDDSEERFMLFNTRTTAKVDDAGIAVGGLPCSQTTDGLWPLTNAICKTQEGISVELYNEADPDGYTHYLFGTDSLTIDTTGGIYTRVAPARIVTAYDRPQAPLYVKSVSLMLGAKGYSVARKTIKVGTLRLLVITESGDTVATSTATSANLSNMSYKAGQMLTFSFIQKNSYGEILKEGFIVRDAFRIVIDGLSNKDNFGIYSAKCSILESGAWVEYTNDMKSFADYEPYIMLNGIFTTFESYAGRKQFQSYETGINGDTISINMVSVNGNPNYKYQAHYAGKDLAAGTTFEFYSTYMPYDSITRTWLMDVEFPEYILLGADFDTNYGTATREISLWTIARAFDVFIYANDTPKLNDEIKISKAGREVVFKIVAIDGATDLKTTTKTIATTSKKIITPDGVVRILQGNNVYTILGQKID